MWNDAAVAYFRVVCYPGLLFEELKKTHHFPIEIAGLWAKI